MIKEIKCYKCRYCGSIYETIESATECLNSHNLVYKIQKYVSSHDCWGKSEGDYEDTDVVFKNYSDAENYIKSNTGTRITWMKLL